LSECGGAKLQVYSWVPWNASSIETFEKWEEQCWMPLWIAEAFGWVSLVLWLAILAVIVFCRVRRLELPWMTVADFTTDICRSRLFTSVSVTWLLFAFYSLLTEYFIHPDSQAHKDVSEMTMQTSGVTLGNSIYFLVLSVAAVPYFVLLLQANNPYRNRAISFLVTATGLVLQHIIAGTIIGLKWWRIERQPDPEPGILVFEVILAGIFPRT
jgi:hypothetical protein